MLDGWREESVSNMLRKIEQDRAAGTLIPAGQPYDPAVFKRELTVPVTEHPAPLVPARAAREVEIPSAARTVRKLAESNGWWVRCTYALGWVLGSRGETRSLTHTLALRMTESGLDEGVISVRRLVAVWKVAEPVQDLLYWAERAGTDWSAPVPAAGWKFDLAYGWGGGQPHHKLSAAALKAMIKEA